MLLTSGVLPIGPDLATVSAEARTVTKSASYMTTYVTKKAVDMKAGKHRKNKTLNTIPKGKTVTHVKSYGSWTQVKYGAKTGYVPTSSLGSKKVVTFKPTPKPTPSNGLTVSEKEKVMSAVFKKTSGTKNGGQYSMTHYVKKTGETLELGGAGMNLDKENGLLALDIGWFNSAYGRTADFGKEAQDELKRIYGKYTDGFNAFSTVTIGAEHASTLQKEFERFALTAGSGEKTMTKKIGGKTVEFKSVYPSFYILVE